MTALKVVIAIYVLVTILNFIILMVTPTILTSNIDGKEQIIGTSHAPKNPLSILKLSAIPIISVFFVIIYLYALKHLDKINEVMSKK